MCSRSFTQHERSTPAQAREWVSNALRSVLLVAACLVGSCVGSGDGVPNPPDPQTAIPKSYDDIVTMIIDPLCAQQCHRGGAAPKGLSLEPLRVIDALVGIPSVEVPELMRVAPGQPNDSYLIVKVSSFDPRRIGSRMPRNGPPFLTQPQISALKRWITAGATDDWVDEDVDAGVFPLIDAGPLDAAFDAVPSDASPVDASAFSAWSPND